MNKNKPDLPLGSAQTNMMEVFLLPALWMMLSTLAPRSHLVYFAINQPIAFWSHTLFKFYIARFPKSARAFRGSMKQETFSLGSHASFAINLESKGPLFKQPTNRGHLEKKWLPEALLIFFLSKICFQGISGFMWM